MDAVGRRSRNLTDMASLNQIVYNIAEIANDSTNSVLIERLKFMVEYYRALFLRRDAERNFNIPDQNVTTLSYETEWVSAVEACGVALPCQILRTTEPVPPAVALKGKSGFYYVGPAGGAESYQYVTAEQVPYSVVGKFSGNVPKYYYKNGYIYIINSSAQCIEVRLVAEAPVTGGNAAGAGTTCIDSDAEYPITGDMIQRITEAIFKNELAAQRPNDDEQIEIK